MSTATTEHQSSVEGSNHEPMDITRTFFGLEPEEKAPEGADGIDPGTEGGDNTPEAGADTADTDPDNDAGNGAEAEGDAGSAEVWEIDGAEYSAEQVTEAVKSAVMFKGFNEAIPNLIIGLRSYEETSAHFKSLALTETEKMIKELTQQINSGRLEAREHQAAYSQLVKAQQRMGVLEAAAEQEKTLRTQTLNEARRTNARQVVTSLTAAGWTRQDLTAADALAQTAFKPDIFADAMNPELMGILRDAAKFRAAQNEAANKLAKQGKRAVQVNAKKNTPVQRKEASAMGSDEWMDSVMWGKK